MNIKEWIVTKSKASILHKTSREEWVLPCGRRNVVIQNQTTCTIFHHQGEMEAPSLLALSLSQAVRPRRRRRPKKHKITVRQLLISLLEVILDTHTFKPLHTHFRLKKNILF